MGISYCDPADFDTLLHLRRERRISWRAVGVGLVIAGFTDKDTGEAWPSRATLRAITGIEETDISRVVHELEAAGFLAIEGRDGRSSIYRLTHGDLATGGKLPPSGKQPPTHGRLASKPVGDQPPISIYNNNTSNKIYTKQFFPEPRKDGQGEKTVSEPQPTISEGDPVPPPPEPPPAKGKGASKKQYPGDLDFDAKKLVALYAEQVKPKSQDDSGSRKVFIATATRLLSEGIPFTDLDRSIRNYAASRKPREKRADEAKYRWGFQTFFGPKNEHWRDYLAIEPQSPGAGVAKTPDSSRDTDPLWLQYHVEQVEAKHGEAMAQGFDAIGREHKSIAAAKEWLEKELACRTA